VSTAALSVYKAQIMLARLIGLALIIPLCAAFLIGTGAGLTDVLALLVLGMLPPAASLGLLFAAKRPLASYVALLGVVPNVALFLLLELSLVQSQFEIGFVVQGALGLPFLYNAVTLARVSVGVRVTAGERHRTRQLGAGRRAVTPVIGAVQGQQELSAAPLR